MIDLCFRLENDKVIELLLSIAIAMGILGASVQLNQFWGQAIAWGCLLSSMTTLSSINLPLEAQTPPPDLNTNQNKTTEIPLNIDPHILQSSPTLQKWLKQIPDVLEDIRSDPSFKTRLKLGYSQFPSNNNEGGLNVAIEDIFLGRTGFTLSGTYYTSFRDRQTGGADVQYYLLPLGSYVNVAPLVGYRALVSGEYNTGGVNVGAKLLLALSRDGSADISLSQSFVSAGGADEVGISTLSVGYAIAPHLRLAADLQKQNTHANKDSRVSIGLEWLLY